MDVEKVPTVYYIMKMNKKQKRDNDIAVLNAYMSKATAFLLGVFFTFMTVVITAFEYFNERYIISTIWGLLTFSLAVFATINMPTDEENEHVDRIKREYRK